MAQLRAWVKQGIIADVKPSEGTDEVILITPGVRFMTKPLAQQTKIATAVCALSAEKSEADVDTCLVVRNGVELGRVAITEAGSDVQWQDWYLAELARRAFAKAN